MSSGNRRKSGRNKRKSNSNIQRLLPVRERFHLHFSAVIFLIVFAYILILLLQYLFKDNIGIYEVVRGNNGKAPTYSALIVRDETLYYSEYSGYVNYYCTQGERVRVNETVCTLDEDGDFMSQLLLTANELSDEALLSLKNSLQSLSLSFDLNDYEDLYTTKSTINLNLLSFLTEEAIESLGGATDEYTFAVTNTPISGTFVSTYDGYEDFDLENFSADEIDPDSYSLTTIASGQLVNEGEPLYKIISSDSFTIVFEMTEEDQETFAEKSTLSVYFSDIDKTITGSFELIYDNNGTTYACVEFSEYGYLLANTRFTDIEISSNIIEGLKIPSSSLVTKDYLLIPKRFCTLGGNSSQYGCMLQYEEDGEIQAVFTAITIIGEYDDDYYLVDPSAFEDGDILIISGEDSTDVYEVGEKQAVQGVYCVNKGYAVFQPVNILAQLDDGYVIVEEGYTGSISCYDRIALNGSLIQEGELIY